MPGTHLSPPPCLPNSNKLVPEPAGLKATSPHGVKLWGGMCGVDLGSVSEATAWHGDCRIPVQSCDNLSCSLPWFLPWPGTGWGAGDK